MRENNFDDRPIFPSGQGGVPARAGGVVKYHRVVDLSETPLPPDQRSVGGGVHSEITFIGLTDIETPRKLIYDFMERKKKLAKYDE